MKKIHIIITVFAVFFLAHSMSEAKGGLSALAEVGKSQGQMERDLNKESSRFKVIREAYVDNKILTGASSEDIRKEFGEPSVIIEDNGAEKWVYKPGYASYFDNLKIYLFFSPEGNLVKIDSRGI